MQLQNLIHYLAEASQDLISTLQTGKSLPNLGLRRAARLPVLLALHAHLQKPFLYITDRTDRAISQVEEIALWTPSAPRLFFPEPNPLFYEKTAWGENTRRERLLVLTNLASYYLPGISPPQEPAVIIAPIRSVMTRTIPRREFLKACRILKIGQMVRLEELVSSLVWKGYEPVNTVISPGQFARRGGILDFWPPAEKNPFRVEFFGDEVETGRTFDPATQRTTSTLQPSEALLITPAREYLLNYQEVTSISGSQASSNQTLADYCEFHLPILHPSPASILDYLPRQAVVIIDNREDLREAVQEFEEQAISLRADYEAEGILPKDFPIPYLTWNDIEDSLSDHQSIQLGPAGGEDSSALAQWFSPQPRFAGRLKNFTDHLLQLTTNGEKTTVVSRQATRLEELWIKQTSVTSNQSDNLNFIEGSLAEGWSFTIKGTASIHLFTDGEIFGWRSPEPRQKRRPAALAPEANYADLAVDDWVVHVDHGIGRFIGLVHRTVDGLEREYLAVEYAEADQLFVPVHQADRLVPYLGIGNRPPALSRLGGSEWKQTKERVKEAVTEVAHDLLDLYAKRHVVMGYAFSPDAPWQQELENSFPYIETEDQIRAIHEVKQDMENPRPMDRLICGDVGYGKTEVALRAAFKSVVDSKQVAILVPTTVLAQQHFNTFRQRLAAYPIEVEMLSRFRTPQQQQQITARLENGVIDIIIGTHRLLQSDVKFKDLGLLIVDEEQRFGVTHKEFLKRMRTEVDVITLTATPIPRTLYMALTGVRDISNINTPPDERLPVVTHVGPYSKLLIRQAVIRELERGGQVFFVHNRVQTISGMRRHLEQLVPEARITIVHGQMPEQELSQRMEQFTAGEIDVLLSTSIIESGLDIPNANTLIVDRADTFGLAQLYQLRGRVGRGAQRAYAYFFKHHRKNPTLTAQQRLETISENTQLGAGFSIAMRDLEIRGAGDILGTRQHGHIAAVGFHLYTRLLAEAVTIIRTDRKITDALPPISLEIQPPLVNVDLPHHVNIPADYIPDTNMRLQLYRRMADIRSLEAVDTLGNEFKDRFGSTPEPFNNLLYQLKIKLLAEKASVTSVSVEGNQICIRFRSGSVPTIPKALSSLVRVGKTALWLPLAEQNGWQEMLLHVLEKL